MSKQEINIQNNTGTINIYNTQDTEEYKGAKKISMAAVDKYSSPLSANIMISPWGEDRYRVSFILRNDLLGQMLQRNYITLNTKEEAKELFDKISDDMTVFKKQAEKELRHSALIIADIWNLLENYQRKYSVVDQPESLDLRARFYTPEINQNFQGARPHGLLIHDVENHWPDHEGIVKSASKNKSWKYDFEKLEEIKPDLFSEIKTIKKARSEFSKGFLKISKDIRDDIDPENLRELASACIYNYLDTKTGKDTKTKILLALKPLFRFRDDEKIKIWANANKDTLEKVSKELEKLAVDYSSTGYKKITQDDYDVFIFDADKTLWDGDAAFELEPPFTIDGNIATGQNEKSVRLKDGVRDMLAGLVKKEKRVGLVSHSEKEGVDFQNQPVILLLKAFDILKYFNEMIVVASDFPKSMFMPNEERVLFIDNKIENLFDVIEYTNADGALPENIIYNPSSIKESVLKTGTVKVSEPLKYKEDFVPLYVVAEPEIALVRKDEKYWEEKEKEILDQFWYTTENLKEEDFQKFLDEMMNKGIDSNSILEVGETPNLLPMFAGSLNVLIKLTENGRKKISATPYKETAFIGDCINSFDEEGNCINDYLPYSDVTDFAQDEENEFEKLKDYGIKVKYDEDKDVHYFYVEEGSDSWYKISGRPRIKSKEIPEKPKRKGEYELDHKKPRWKKGKDTKDNLQWIEKNKHKEKTKEEGSYEYGGKDRHKKLKEKGKDEYSKYQSDTGKAKVEKERKELGEKAFSEKQRERAKKRWKKSYSDSWYKISEENIESDFKNFLKISNSILNLDEESLIMFMGLHKKLIETFGKEDGFQIFMDLAKLEGDTLDPIRKSIDNQEDLSIFKQYVKENIIKPLVQKVINILQINPRKIEENETKNEISNLFERARGFSENN